MLASHNSRQISTCCSVELQCMSMVAIIGVDECLSIWSLNFSHCFTMLAWSLLATSHNDMSHIGLTPAIDTPPSVVVLTFFYSSMPLCHNKHKKWYPFYCLGRVVDSTHAVQQQSIPQGVQIVAPVLIFFHARITT